MSIIHIRSQQRTDQRVLVLTLKFLALKKLVFLLQKYFPICFWLFSNFYSMQFFSADATVFSKKKDLFFCLWKLKKQASKVAHNWPQTFFTVMACYPNQPRIDFSYYKYVPKIIWLSVVPYREGFLKTQTFHRADFLLIAVSTLKILLHVPKFLGAHIHVHFGWYCQRRFAKTIWL